MSTFEPGSRVGAQRWPYHAAHPDAWGAPHGGTVLRADDPQAWAGTLAFPSHDPDPVAVRAHVEKSGSHLDGLVPVMWDFGRVYWEDVARVVPYEVDRAAWLAARQARVA
jgi:hypothetical protein